MRLLAGAPARRHYVSLDEDGIAELGGAISPGLQHPVSLTQGRAIGECAQQLVVTRDRLVGARKDRIDDPQLAVRSDALCSDSAAGL
jgi:hypothetical protein